MGKIVRLLAKEEFVNRSLFENCIRTEIAECFHVHWRDMRILMDRDQFTTFIKCVTESHSGLKFGEDRLLRMLDVPGKAPFRDEAKIEEIEGGCIHFHYRDMRLELEPACFVKLCNLFSEARRKYCFRKDSVLLPLSDVDPYDHCHFKDKTDWSSEEEYKYHIDGAYLFAEYIKKGYQIKPIIVTDNNNGLYKRRDGFKRYLAYSFLGITTIPAFVVTEEGALTCPQHGQYPFIQKGAFDDDAS